MCKSIVATVLYFFVLFSLNAQADSNFRSKNAQADSLYRAGMASLNTDDLDTAEAQFRAAIQIDNKHAPAYVGLGHIYLKQENLKAAEQVFKDARSKKHDYAPAYNGLGLVAREKPNGLYTAIGYFRKALRYDRDYLEAQYHIAETRYKMEEHDTKREAEKLIEMDPAFAPAYWLLGEWYETFKGDYKQAEQNYKHYLSLKPDDLKVIQRLAGIYQKTGAHTQTVALLNEQTRAHPDAIELLPQLAIAYMELDSLDRATAVFDNYLDHSAPSERALYEDIRLLTSSDEYNEFQQAPNPEAFLSRFWGDRDADLITPANERQLEHYRRVWFARQHFSKSKQPWDTRGEVYVRFGEPDHRSQSDWQNFQQSLAVQRVKESLASQLYNRSRTHSSRASDSILTIPLDASFSGPAFPVRSLKNDLGGITYKPVISSEPDLSMVPWESWVYTDVGRGMEVTFTDEFQNGKFDYAPPPIDSVFDLKQLAAFAQMSPRNVTVSAMALTPDYYQPRANENPFEFYYDLADFRGPTKTESALEVYTGIPQEMAHYLKAENVTWLGVERSVGVLSKETGEVYRIQGDVQFRQEGNTTQQPGALVPDVVRLNLPPGYYRMEIKVKDKRTGRRGRYRQTIQVEPYPEMGLNVSDLELAWRITEDQEEEDKFIKGDLHVVPMPTRTYGKSQSVYVYYEIYNLKRDTFGQTHYRVAYTIAGKGNAAVGNIARLVRIRGDQREEVAVTYEQQGTTASEVAYVALDLGENQTGRQTLQVEVTDLNSGETIQKQAIFVVK